MIVLQRQHPVLFLDSALAFLVRQAKELPIVGSLRVLDSQRLSLVEVLDSFFGLLGDLASAYQIGVPFHEL